jgi:hypothetical protein
MSIRRLAYIVALAIVPAVSACGEDVTGPSDGARIVTENPTSATGQENQEIID